MGCKYSLYTCRSAGFRSCKVWRGTVRAKGVKVLRSKAYIKGMVSIKGSSTAQVPKPSPPKRVVHRHPKPIIPKLPKLPKLPTLPKLPFIPKLPIKLPIIPGAINPALAPTPTVTAVPAAGAKPIIPAPLDPKQAAAAAKGTKFCAANCVIDHSKVQKKCLVGSKLTPCKRCTGKPTNKDAGMKGVCEIVCNANLPASPCDFYGYLNNQKKKTNLTLLAKYGLSILRKFKKL